MKLEEAIKKYGIQVPSDAEFYSDEYKEYFEKGVRTPELIDKFSKYEEFQTMYVKSFYITYHRAQKEFQKEGKSMANSEAVVLGGQAGAGKGGLVILTKREYAEKGKEIFIIDDDEYRKCYPKEKREGLLQECPEYYTIVTAIGSSNVTPKIMKYASDNGLNFLFDGTMKNPRILGTVMTWNNYKINWKIMATSKLESLISVFERNDKLRKMQDCRFITVDVHNETYAGLVSTVANLESMDNMGRIQVYTRGDTKENPIKMYDSLETNQKYKTAVSAIIDVREENKKKCIKNGVANRIKALKESEIPKNDAEIKALMELEQTVNSEIEFEK